MANFINDGYTIDGFISGVPGLTDDFGFKFRPSTAHENQVVQGEWGRADNDGERFSAATAKFLLKHLVSWDGKWPDGSPVPLTIENLGKMRGRLRVALVDIVQGIRVPDDRPAAAAATSVSESLGN